MKKKNSVPKRIDPELDDIIKEIKEKNDLNFRQASKEAAKIIKGVKIVKKEIKF